MSVKLNSVGFCRGSQRPWSELMIVGLLLLWATPSHAQRVKVETGQQYLILEITKLATLTAELNDAAKQGFRLRMAAVESPRVTALMDRTATPAAPFEYQIVNTFSSKTGDKEMNAAAGDGFRAVPHTFMVKKGFTVFNVDNVVVMEKSPEQTKTYEYRTINAARTSTLDKELKAALADDWQVFDMVHGQILLERSKPQP